MRNVLSTAVVVLAAASISFAEGIPAHGITGNYIEARTADVYTGPCFANGEAEQVGREAVFGWRINEGQWKGVNLAGLSVVGVIRSEHTLGLTTEPIIPPRPCSSWIAAPTPNSAWRSRALPATWAANCLPSVVKVVLRAHRADHRGRQHPRRGRQADRRLAGRNRDPRHERCRSHLRQRRSLVSAADADHPRHARLHPGERLSPAMASARLGTIG